MRCDLHVHTDRSGMCTVPLARRFCQESYNDPMEVYWGLKRRGMDLVTVTDHDSIDAVECLRHYPDFFLSEEVTCTLPSGTGVHVGVYDITERDHTEIQRRRAQRFQKKRNQTAHDLSGSRAGASQTTKPEHRTTTGRRSAAKCPEPGPFARRSNRRKSSSSRPPGGNPS